MARKSQLTIGDFATTLLKNGYSAAATLERVQRVFPTCKTTLKCIYFYASKAKVALRPGQLIMVSELEAVMAELEALKEIKEVA